MPCDARHLAEVGCLLRAELGAVSVAVELDTCALFDKKGELTSRIERRPLCVAIAHPLIIYHHMCFCHLIDAAAACIHCGRLALPRFGLRTMYPGLT